MTRPTRATLDGAAYLDLQSKSRQAGRPMSELLQLYALAGFLDRLVQSSVAERLVLKGGVLLAAFDARRPTRDIDLQARAMHGDVEETLDTVRGVASVSVSDGLVFDAANATAIAIRGEEAYSGVRVSMTARLNRVRAPFHIDVNVGDPVWPEPQMIEIPRILEGTLRPRGYPLPMVCAEKIVTALARGTANTRWRDFADVYALASRHPLEGALLEGALQRVADFRQVPLSPLAGALTGYADLAQKRWQAWLRKNALTTRFPSDFGDVLALVIKFADPVMAGEVSHGWWDPSANAWQFHGRGTECV